jgi:hypothetical protein
LIDIAVFIIIRKERKFVYEEGKDRVGTEP